MSMMVSDNLEIGLTCGADSGVQTQLLSLLLIGTTSLRDWDRPSRKLSMSLLLLCEVELCCSTADSTLINGLGRFAGGSLSELSVITVDAGKR